MSVLGYTGQVTGQVEAQVTAPVTPQDAPQVTPQVGGQPELQPEWFSKGGWTFLSANWSKKKERVLSSPRQSLIAGWKTHTPVIDLSAVSCSVVLAEVEILEKIGV